MEYVNDLIGEEHADWPFLATERPLDVVRALADERVPLQDSESLERADPAGQVARMDTTHRPMTARERAELEALVSPWTYGARATLLGGVLFVLGWFLRTVQAGLTQAAFPIWLVATAAVGLGLYFRAGRWTGGGEFRGRIRADLDGGTMLVRRIRVVEAIEAPEVEDEGPVFFILGEDGSRLFFAGQDLARHRRRGFPWVEFDVSHAPQSEQLLKVRSSGGTFDAVQRRAPLTMTEARELGLLKSDFGSLSADWAELKG